MTYNLKERTFEFAKKIFDIIEKLPNKSHYDVIRKQLSKSGTSIGANLQEADGSNTKKDFVNKMAIARKEAKETEYWLRLISDKCLEEQEIRPLIQECRELICILSSIILKCRQ